MSAQNKKNDARERVAAARRERHVKALESELEGVKAAASSEQDETAKARLEARVTAIGEELKRVKSGPKKPESRSGQQQTRS